jgi:hypothetical protein
MHQSIDVDVVLLHTSRHRYQSIQSDLHIAAYGLDIDNERSDVDLVRETE